MTMQTVTPKMKQTAGPALAKPPSEQRSGLRIGEPYVSRPRPPHQIPGSCIVSDMLILLPRILVAASRAEN